MEDENGKLKVAMPEPEIYLTLRYDPVSRDLQISGCIDIPVLALGLLSAAEKILLVRNGQWFGSAAPRIVPGVQIPKVRQ